jgi:hypothetical protein
MPSVREVNKQGIHSRKLIRIPEKDRKKKWPVQDRPFLDEELLSSIEKVNEGNKNR